MITVKNDSPNPFVVNARLMSDREIDEIFKNVKGWENFELRTKRWNEFWNKYNENNVQRKN